MGSEAYYRLIQACQMSMESPRRVDEEFVEDHKQEIIDEWYDLYAFSNDVHFHSVSPFLNEVS